MRSLPADLAPDLLRSALASGWSLGSGAGLGSESGIDPGFMEYLPEGAGAYHWKLTGPDGQAYFVTVDDLDTKDWFGSTRPLVFAGLGQALSVATALRFEAELEFVVAPLLADDGQPLRRLDDRYSASVFPFLPGRSFEFGPYPDERLRTEALELVAHLHQAGLSVGDRARVHTPDFGGREDLAAFFAEPDRPWDSGPFGVAAHQLLAEHVTGIARLVDAFDQLVVRSAASRANPVITHGEPHPGNLRSSGGRLYLVDWDTVALGPPERDISLIAADREDLLDHYRRLTGRDLDPDVITLYRLRWYLDDLGSAVEMFRNAHEETADTRNWYEALAPQLVRLPGWIERADADG